MSKAGNWVPIDKGAIKTLGNIGRPYSVVEALFSHTVDVDCGKPWTINGYAKMWDWSRGKVRRFVNSLRTHSGHIADRKGTQSGHPVHLIDGSLWGEADTKRTHSGHIADSKRDTTIDPKPKPKEKTKRFIPPNIKEIKAYCLERNNGVDPVAFYNHYETTGWMRGKNKIKNWKSCVITWEKNSPKPAKQINNADDTLAMLDKLKSEGNG